MSLYRPALAGILGLAIAATAQEPDAILTLTQGGAAKDSVEVRPNSKQTFKVNVKNNSKQEETFTVELEIPVAGMTPDKPGIVLRKQVTLGGGKDANVAFEPPAPPKKEEPPKTPAEGKKEAEAALKPEPPEGTPVPVSERAHSCSSCAS